MEVFIEVVNAQLRAELLAVIGPSSQALSDDPGDRGLITVEAPAVRSMFPDANEAIRLVVDLATGIGASLFAAWLWHKIRGKNVRVLIERREYTFTTEDEVQCVVTEVWRTNRRGA